jgi:predicted metal-dependent phosphoesterase TrpH
LRYVGNPDLISRTHFARWLVDEGRCKTIGDVFANICRKVAPALCRTAGPRLAEAVGWIRRGRHRRDGASGPLQLHRHQHDALFDEFTSWADAPSRS